MEGAHSSDARNRHDAGSTNGAEGGAEGTERDGHD